MDQQLKFDILANTAGSDAVNELKNRFLSLGGAADGLNSKLVNFASGTFLLEKGFELAHAGVEKFKEALDMGENLAILSEKTGIAATTISQFEGAAKQSNIQIETLEKSLKKFTQNLGDINNEKFTRGLEALKISSRDSSGQLKTSSVVLNEIADKFQNMKDGPAKAAIAVGLFGKSGSDIIPLLNMGSEEIAKFGYKMGSEFPAMAKRFNDSIEDTKKSLTEGRINFLEGVLPDLQTIIDSFNVIDKSSEKTGKTIGQYLGSGLKVAADLIYMIGSGLVNIGDVLFTVSKDIFGFIGSVLQEIFEALKGISHAVVKIATMDFSNLGEGFNHLGDSLTKNALDRRETYRTLIDRVLTRSDDQQNFSKLLNSNFKKPLENRTATGTAPEQEDQKYKKEAEAIQKFRIAQEEQIAVEKLKINNYALSKAELDKLTISQQLHSQALKESVGWTPKAKAEMMAASEEIIKQRQALIDLQEQQKQSFEVGARTALRDYVDRLRDVASQTKDMFTRAFTNMEDALVNFVKTGKLSFRSFADAVIDDLIRIAVRQATLGVLTSIGIGIAGASQGGTPPLGSNGSGYLGANTTFISKFANGGIANKPQVAMFGEAGPEAFVPLPDGRSIPVSMKGGSAGNVSVVVQVNMTSGEEKTSGDKDAQGLGRAISVAVKNEISTQMRPGGMLYGRV